MKTATAVCFVFLALFDGGCGQLVLSMGGGNSGTPTLAPGTFDSNCADKLENCAMFGANSCGGQYEQWARDNCALTCKYCTGPATSAPPCVDSLDNCDSYGKEACDDPQYRNWAMANCRRLCRQQLCTAAQNAQIDAMKTTMSPAQCVDKLDCRLYGQSSCTGDYEHWARENCPNYCKYCTGVVTNKPCLDTRPNCSQYEKTMCSNPQYTIWVDDNCPQYCGRCSGLPTTAPPCIDTRPNCAQYQEDMCTNPEFHLFAQDNCRKFCKFCDGGSGPVAATSAPNGHMLTPPPLNRPATPPLPGRK